MRLIQNYHFKLFILITVIFFSCNNNQDAKQKELDLKEKELNLRDKEIKLTEKEDSLKNIKTDLENIDYDKINAKIESKANDENKKIESHNTQKNINEILTEDFKSVEVSKLPKIWGKRYELLPNKFKNTVFTDNGTYKIKNNESGVEELIRGFSWSCGNNEKMDKLGEIISIDIGYNNPNLTYKAGMVYFYYKNQILNCIY